MTRSRNRYRWVALALASAALALAAALVGASAGHALTGAQGFSFTPIAVLGDPAPGGGSFTFDFEPSAINNSGEVAFTADVTTGGEGVFEGRSGALSQVTRSGLPAPGGVTIGAGELGRLGLNAGGDVAAPFLLDPFTPPVGLNSGLFRLSHNSGALSAVVVPGTPAPGGGTFQGVFFNTSMNNRGQIVFPGLATGTDIDPNSPPGYNGIASALFVADKHGNISSAVLPGDPAPGGGVFDAALNGSLNSAGDIAFGGHVSGEECIDIGSPFVCGESVYLRDAATGAIRSIAHQGDPAPGGGTFVLAFGGVVNGRDDVAFIGRLTPQPNLTSGVFLYSKGTLVSVARPGDPLPGGGHMANAGNNDATYGLNNRGDVSFAATLDTDDNGDGIPDSGVYVSSRGVVRLVARTGTVIPGLGTIAYLGYGTPIPTATGGMLNDRGQVLFFATLTNGNGVLLVATP
jgi:hypothetical protein